jgi:hypothetical protein
VVVSRTSWFARIISGMTILQLVSTLVMLIAVFLSVVKLDMKGFSIRYLPSLEDRATPRFLAQPLKRTLT